MFASPFVPFEDAVRKVELSPLLDYIGYLSAPHPDLGREGPVCPYTRPAMEASALFVAMDTSRSITGPTLRQHARLMLREFHGIPTRKERLKCLLFVFPNLGELQFGLIDETQKAMKVEFVMNGLMIGQFHPKCEEPGLWSSRFRPLKAPIPMLAVRHMAITDIAFLVSIDDCLAEYLRRFGDEGRKALDAYLMKMAI